MILLALKLTLVPALIAGVTLAGRRWGPGVAGWLSAFPILSGPILLFLALEQGPGFAAEAAHGTLLAVLAIVAFSLAYAWTALRRPWPECLLVALCCWGLAALGLQRIDADLGLSFVAVIAALLLAPLAFPVLPRWVSGRAGAGDLPWRMLAAALLVLIVSALAARLGPRLSGLLAMFPVMSTVLVGFSHRQSGGAFAIRLLRGMFAGYYAFACFCAVLALALPAHGIATAFCAALGVALPVHALARQRVGR